MKRFYLLSFVMMFLMTWGVALGQQNMVVNPGMEEWDDATTPTGWDKHYNISQESTIVHSGTYSAAHESAETTKKLRQDISNVVPGTEYTISFWYYDNDPNAKMRIWSYWMDAEQNYLDDDQEVLRPNEFSTESSDWQQFSVTLTAPVNAAYFRFDVRVYNQDGNTGGKVYYDDFFFGGQASNDPEPSNYPTDFTAESEGLDIHLSWTDATGEHLPIAYLIVAAKNEADLFAPQDGTVYANDDDFSDGVGVHNVSYGVQEDYFENLEPNTTFYFAIYPYSNGGENIDYKTDGSAPTATATTQNVVILSCEEFEDGTLGVWTPVNVLGDQEWEAYTYNGNTFAKMSGYASGSHANEDWLISPLVDFTGAGISEAGMHLANATKYNGNPLQLLVSTDYDGSGDPNNFTWTDISDEVDWSPGNFEWVDCVVELNDYIGQQIYLAFKYTSTDESSATWELDDLCIGVILNTGIDENATQNLKVYPNPATDMVTVSAGQAGKLNVFDLTGKMINTFDLHNGDNILSVSGLQKGMYILNFQLNDGTQKTEKLIVK